MAWRDIEVSSYPDSALVHVRPHPEAFVGTPQSTRRTVRPDLVLLRSFVLGNHEHDWRHKMGGFLHHGTPCINSLSATVWSTEKSVQWGLLRRVASVCPGFPLVPQIYYSHPSTTGFAPDFPCVVKVGSASQGLGKARVADSGQWQDCVSLLSMQSGAWFVSEPHVTWVADIRVQRIGKHYRAIRRTRTGSSSAWKANDAIGITEEDVPVEARWRRWADACAQVLEMDILGLDILQEQDGSEHVLECNGSSIGFPERHRAEDSRHIAELVLQRLNSLFVPPRAELPTTVPWAPALQDLAPFVAVFRCRAEPTPSAVAHLRAALARQNAWRDADVMVLQLQPCSRIVPSDTASIVPSTYVLLWLECAAREASCRPGGELLHQLDREADKVRHFALPVPEEDLMNAIEVMCNELKILERCGDDSAGVEDAAGWRAGLRDSVQGAASSSSLVNDE